MTKKRMYRKLKETYCSPVSFRIPRTVREVEKTAMAIADRLWLTAGEREACREIFEDLGFEDLGEEEEHERQPGLLKLLGLLLKLTSLK